MLVSIIVPTKNSQRYLEKCLKSIKNQTYKNIEIILVDNFSTDATPEIAKKYVDKFFSQGPERSAQVNFGVSKASGEYVYKVDSDFLLDPEVVSQCVAKAKEGYQAVVVHNSLDTSVSLLAKVRNFEVSMYKYDLSHSSARFVKKSVYEEIGGFDSNITAGEDYDFQDRLNKKGIKTGFVDAEALHLDEPKNKEIFKLLKKFFGYGLDSARYMSKNKDQVSKHVVRVVYFKHWRKFLLNPFIAILFVCYMILKFGAGGLGLVYGKIFNKTYV
jgi:glycosyltransferase involved in cell wall biosynthesis